MDFRKLKVEIFDERESVTKLLFDEENKENELYEVVCGFEISDILLKVDSADGYITPITEWTDFTLETSYECLEKEGVKIRDLTDEEIEIVNEIIIDYIDTHLDLSEYKY